MRKLFVSPLMLAALSASCSLVPPLDPVTSPVSAKFLGKTGGKFSADIAWQKFFTDPRLLDPDDLVSRVYPRGR